MSLTWDFDTPNDIQRGWTRRVADKEYNLGHRRDDSRDVSAYRLGVDVGPTVYAAAEVSSVVKAMQTALHITFQVRDGQYHMEA